MGIGKTDFLWTEKYFRSLKKELHLYLKVIYSEKATKLVMSKKIGRFFFHFWPFWNIWTLNTHSIMLFATSYVILKDNFIFFCSGNKYLTVLIRNEKKICKVGLEIKAENFSTDKFRKMLWFAKIFVEGHNFRRTMTFWHSWAKARFAQEGIFFALKLFAGWILLIKKLDIEKTKHTFIISVLKDEYYVGLVFSISNYFILKIYPANKLSVVYLQ